MVHRSYENPTRDKFKRTKEQKLHTPLQGKVNKINKPECFENIKNIYLEN